MNDLIERLKAAIDEDERIARAATPGPWDTTGPDTIAQWGIYDRDWCVAEATAYDHDDALGQPRGPGYINPDANAAFIAHNDPASVLRRVAADREILELHNPITEHECATCYSSYVTYPCPTIRALAKGYGMEPVVEAEPKVI